jgi:hypothetical protein
VIDVTGVLDRVQQGDPKAERNLFIRPLMSALRTLGWFLLLVGCASPSPRAWVPRDYKGRPFQDSVYAGGPQKIPGKVYCAYYDTGGEGVAYHDNTAKNLGSGGLNPANGSYLNEFRMKEGVDISYVKFHGEIDNNPFNKVQPPDKMLYVGWAEPGEWFNLTVDVAEEGVYAIELLYTSHQGGTIRLDLNGKPLTEPLKLLSTFDASEPVAWRQWHHWNLLENIARVKLPKGTSLLTVHILTEGNMNLGYFGFSACPASEADQP